MSSTCENHSAFFESAFAPQAHNFCLRFFYTLLTGYRIEYKLHSADILVLKMRMNPHGWTRTSEDE